MLTRSLAIVLALAVHPVLLADEHEDRFVSQMRIAIQEREAKHEELESHLKDLQAGRINRRMQQRETVTESRGRKRYVWNSPEAKEKAIAKVQQQIDRLGSDADLLPVLRIGGAVQVGAIGKLPEVVESVRHVLSGGEAVALPEHTIYQHRISQVIDDNNALVAQRRINSSGTVTGTEVFWLVSPTDGAVDGSPLKMSSAYRVAGTRQYATAAGSAKTVAVLEPIDAARLIQRAKQPD